MENCEICRKEGAVGFGGELKKKWDKVWCKECHKKAGLILAKDHWNRCPLCDSKFDFELVKGNDLIKCKKCAAEWLIYNPKEVMLYKSDSDKKHDDFFGATNSLDWWKGAKKFVTEKSESPIKRNGIITTTTETVPGRKISEVIRTVYAKSEKWTTEVRARNSALEKIIEEAEKMGADAIIGIRYDRERASVGAYGTAVKLKPKK